MNNFITGVESLILTRNAYKPANNNIIHTFKLLTYLAFDLTRLNGSSGCFQSNGKANKLKFII